MASLPSSDAPFFVIGLAQAMRAGIGEGCGLEAGGWIASTINKPVRISFACAVSGAVTVVGSGRTRFV
jgi:hypothetical protein